MSSILARGIVRFYGIWHGRFHFKGAGLLLNYFAPRLKELWNYPLVLPNGKVAGIDFRELSGMGWLNVLAGDAFQETPLVQAMARCVDSQSVVWDIGANAGVLSFMLSRETAIGELHFFEPNPKLFPWAAAALSHLAMATGHPLAISSQSGEATLHIPRSRSAFGSLETRDQADVDNVAVMMTTADDLVYQQGLRPPQVIKIDTEGHEIQVLAGMRRLIREHRPVVFFEHIEIPDSEIPGLIPAGYRLQTVSNPDGFLTESLDREAGHNSVLIPDEHPLLASSNGSSSR